MIGMLLFCI